MRASPKEFTDLRAYIGASRELNSWIAGARVFALLSGALDSGVLAALQTKGTPSQIASATNSDPQTIADLCQALESHGIVQRDGEQVQLTPNYARLMSPDAAVPLAIVIRYAAIMIRSLQSSAPADGTYTTMSPEDMVAFAAGSGISALSSSPRVGQETIAQAMPEVAALWSEGARHLEVGCGVGNSLFGTVIAYPRVTAVGIEIDASTAAEAERRAGLLGVADRVELRIMDACDLQDVERFDTIQWSQFFFPAASRPVVLRAMRRALKPGGYLFMPWLGSVSSDTAPNRGAMLRTALQAMRSGGFSFLSYLNDVLGDTARRRKQERRFASLQRLLFSRWGVPVRALGELRAEVEEGGFRVVRATRTPASQFALTRGFLLAQRNSA